MSCIYFFWRRNMKDSNKKHRVTPGFRHVPKPGSIAPVSHFKTHLPTRNKNSMPNLFLCAYFRSRIPKLRSMSGKNILQAQWKTERIENWNYTVPIKQTLEVGNKSYRLRISRGVLNMYIEKTFFWDRIFLHLFKL